MKPIKSLLSGIVTFIAIGFCFAANSCGPKIYFFTAKPFTKIIAGDSVFLDWKVRGKSTLLVYEDPAGDDENPGKHDISYKLVAQKGGKEASWPTLSLTVLPDSNVFHLIIHTITKGDSAIAAITLDTAKWGRHFVISGVAADTKTRPLTVVHMDKSIELTGNDLLSTGLNGLPTSGLWEIRTLLTPNEKRDSTQIPGRLGLKLLLHHQAH